LRIEQRASIFAVYSHSLLDTFSFSFWMRWA
jgi:hypothetical protein